MSLGSLQGFAPTVQVTQRDPESVKYTRLWNTPHYRAVAPGEIFAEKFLVHANPKLGSHVIDFGCGTGRGALKLHESGLQVSMLDFTTNCLDSVVARKLSKTFTFTNHDLRGPSPVVAEYGYCTDVMEHIIPQRVELVIENIVRGAKICYFAISTTEDVCGKLIGETLHVSCHPYAWWKEKFEAMFCKILWSEESDGYAHFLVTAWEDTQVIVDRGELNITNDEIREQMKVNCGAGWNQVQPYEGQDVEVMILGGGPSLINHLDEIHTRREAGAKLVTLNGTYNWCVERGLIPSATIIVDAREFNKRFTKPVVDDCVYLMASQCHPAVLEGLPRDRTYLWHVYNKDNNDIITEHYPQSWPIPGGSTVLLRAIPLLRTLGFHRFHLYGCDSCLSDDTHHAYTQVENDNRTVVNIMVTGGRVFRCHPWMAVQAREFITLIKNLGETFDMIVHGDGLLSHIINTGAEIAPNEEE